MAGRSCCFPSLEGIVAGRDKSGRQRAISEEQGAAFVEAGNRGRRRYLDLFEAGTETVYAHATSLCIAVSFCLSRSPLR